MVISRCMAVVTRNCQLGFGTNDISITNVDCQKTDRSSCQALASLGRQKKLGGIECMKNYCYSTERMATPEYQQRMLDYTAGQTSRGRSFWLLTSLQNCQRMCNNVFMALGRFCWTHQTLDGLSINLPRVSNTLSKLLALCEKNRVSFQPDFGRRFHSDKCYRSLHFLLTRSRSKVAAKQSQSLRWEWPLRSVLIAFLHDHRT